MRYQNNHNEHQQFPEQYYTDQPMEILDTTGYSNHHYSHHHQYNSLEHNHDNDCESIPPADRRIFDDEITNRTIDTCLMLTPVAARKPVHMSVSTQSKDTINAMTNYYDVDEKRIPTLDENWKYPSHFNYSSSLVLPNNLKTLLRQETFSNKITDSNSHISNQRHQEHSKRLEISSSTYWIAGSEITDDDVICERGGKSNRHVGTKRYRGLVEKYKSKYQSLTSKTEKTNLSRMIIAMIQEKGGRFLKKTKVSTIKGEKNINGKEQHYYHPLSPVETTKKVSQAMREKKILKWTTNN